MRSSTEIYEQLQYRIRITISYTKGHNYKFIYKLHNMPSHEQLIKVQNAPCLQQDPRSRNVVPVYGSVTWLKPVFSQSRFVVHWACTRTVTAPFLLVDFRRCMNVTTSLQRLQDHLRIYAHMYEHLHNNIDILQTYQNIYKILNNSTNMHTNCFKLLRIYI